MKAIKTIVWIIAIIPLATAGLSLGPVSPNISTSADSANNEIDLSWTESFDAIDDDGQRDASVQGDGSDDGINKWLVIDKDTMSGSYLWIYGAGSRCNSSAASDSYRLKVNDNSSQSISFSWCEMFGEEYINFSGTGIGTPYDWQKLYINNSWLIDDSENKFNFYDTSSTKYHNWYMGYDNENDNGRSAWSSNDNPSCQPIRGTNPLRQDGSCYNEEQMIRFGDKELYYRVFRSGTSSQTLFSQVGGAHDTFFDGEYTNNPSWSKSGDGQWEVTDGVLWSTSTGSSGSSLTIPEDIGANESFIFKVDYLTDGAEHGIRVGGRYIRRHSDEYQVDGTYVDKAFGTHWKVIYEDCNYQFYADDLLIREWSACSDGIFRLEDDRNTVTGTKYYWDNVELTPIITDISQGMTDTSATDNAEPGSPSGVSSSSHTIGTWSNDDTITTTWTDASDSGTDYYYYLEAADEDGEESNIFDTDLMDCPESNSFEWNGSGTPTGDFRVYSNFIPVSEGDTFVFSFERKAENVVAGQGFFAQVYECNETQSCVHNDNLRIGTLVAQKGGDFPWEKVERYFTVVNADTTRMRVLPRVNDFSGESSFRRPKLMRADTANITTGLDGFDSSFTHGASDITTDSKDVEDGVESKTSASITGTDIYFNIKSVDNAGNWDADADTVHVGPYYVCNDELVDGDNDNVITLTNINEQCGCDAGSIGIMCDAGIDGTAEGVCLTSTACDSNYVMDSCSYASGSCGTLTGECTVDNNQCFVGGTNEDYNSDGVCSGGACVACASENNIGLCSDGIDNDCDGLVDEYDNSCCPAITGDNFTIKSKTTGDDCMVIDPDGNMRIKGTLAQGSIPSDPSDSFLVKTVSGSTTVAYVDSSCNVKITGNINPNYGSFIVDNDDGFIIGKASDATLKFKIDASGNLYTKGMMGSSCS